MLTVNRLCCMRLNTAGVVIGWVWGILSSIYLILFALALSHLDEIVKLVFEQMPASPDITEDSVRSIVIAVIAIALTSCVVNIISSILLVAGSIQERHIMLVPWLVNNGFSLILGVSNLVYFVVKGIYYGKSFGTISGFSLALVINLSIHYYIWTAIYSLYRVIRSSRERQLLIPTSSGAAGTAYPSYTKI